MQFSTAFATLALATSAALVGAVPVPENGVNEQQLSKRTSGQATYFQQGGQAGACGKVNSDSALIVAVNSAMFDQSKCGSTVNIHAADGKTVTATVADECPGCSAGSLDLSQGAFQKIADLSQGVIGITWSYA